MKKEIVDARNGDYVIVTGEIIRKLLKDRISGLQSDLTRLLGRLNNEIPDKADAVGLMVSLAGDPRLLNERALFFKASLERAAFLEKEIRELLALGHTFSPGVTYRITVDDAVRYGLS